MEPNEYASDRPVGAPRDRVKILDPTPAEKADDYFERRSRVARRAHRRRWPTKESRRREVLYAVLMVFGISFVSVCLMFGIPSILINAGVWEGDPITFRAFMEFALALSAALSAVIVFIGFVDRPRDRNKL